MYKCSQMCHRFVYNNLSHEMNVAFVNAQVNHEQYMDFSLNVIVTDESYK